MQLPALPPRVALPLSWLGCCGWTELLCYFPWAVFGGLLFGSWGYTCGLCLERCCAFTRQGARDSKQDNPPPLTAATAFTITITRTDADSLTQPSPAVPPPPVPRHPNTTPAAKAVRSNSTGRASSTNPRAYMYVCTNYLPPGSALAQYIRVSNEAAAPSSTQQQW